MSKKNNVSNKSNCNKGAIKIQKFIECPIYKLIIGILSILLSVTALIISCIAFNHSRQIEPFTYEFSVENEDTLNVSVTEDASVDYNITPLNLHIENGTGDIDEILIAYVKDGVIDIKSNTFRNDFECNFEKGLMVYFRYSGSGDNIDIKVGFNDLNSDCSGYFFVIFKSYDGEYYYNIVHHIKEKSYQYDDNSKLYWINVDTRFFRNYDIYDRSLMNELCTIINENSDSKINLDDYIDQIEQDYYLIKSKIE